MLPALDRLTPVPPLPWLGREIEARTMAGDVVLELHSRGGWVARAALDRLRRAFAIETTALTRLVAEIVLRPPDLRHLDAAVSAIVVGHPGARGRPSPPARGLYSSRCATCGASVVVDEFIWDIDASDPSRKSLPLRPRAARMGDRPTSIPMTSTTPARSIRWRRARPSVPASRRRATTIRSPTTSSRCSHRARSSPWPRSSTASRARAGPLRSRPPSGSRSRT